MQENEVTSAGQTWRLPDPFWVLATQNPIEQEGTYPLPEAQQDRFMYALQMDYPDAATEFEIARTTTSPANQRIEAVVSLEQIRRFKQLVWTIPVADSVVRYAVTLTRATRPSHQECPDTLKRYLTWGAGPRASQFLLLSAKAHAALDKRPTPDVQDVKRAAFAVLRHRLVRSFHAEVENISTTEIIQQLLKSI
jgi:MoxR-like ATPase